MTGASPRSPPKETVSPVFPTGISLTAVVLLLITPMAISSAMIPEITDSLVEYTKSLKGFHSCVIECDPEQAVSKRIALKNGFTYEGEDDGCDVYRLRF